MLEADFQLILKAELNSRFPGCVVIKQDPNTSFQGVPDWLVLYGNRWAALENKRGAKAKRQPNQEYYVDLLDDMSFAAFIHPGNYLDVLDDLERAFNS